MLLGAFIAGGFTIYSIMHEDRKRSLVWESSGANRITAEALVKSYSSKKFKPIADDEVTFKSQLKLVNRGSEGVSNVVVVVTSHGKGIFSKSALLKVDCLSNSNLTKEEFSISKQNSSMASCVIGHLNPGSKITIEASLSGRFAYAEFEVKQTDFKMKLDDKKTLMDHIEHPTLVGWIAGSVLWAIGWYYLL